ncbi:MAG: hypothetical protein J7K75_10995, partial [Desulfuromonas sp.]|nr:hypothetical protein [Desulfuromonas sp.]
PRRAGFKSHFFAHFLWGFAKKGCRLRDETRDLEFTDFRGFGSAVVGLCFANPTYKIYTEEPEKLAALKQFSGNHPR